MTRSPNRAVALASPGSSMSTPWVVAPARASSSAMNPAEQPTSTARSPDRSSRPEGVPQDGQDLGGLLPALVLVQHRGHLLGVGQLLLAFGCHGFQPSRWSDASGDGSDDAGARTAAGASGRRPSRAPARSTSPQGDREAREQDHGHRRRRAHAGAEQEDQQALAHPDPGRRDDGQLADRRGERVAAHVRHGEGAGSVRAADRPGQDPGLQPERQPRPDEQQHA